MLKVNEELSEEDLINRILKKIAKSFKLSSGEISDAVELYYDAQKLRLMHGNKERSEAPDQLVEWLARWLRLGENVILGKLKSWIQSEEAPAEARWAYEQIGIGPVIAAGLAAHIDVTRAQSISAVWKFAGQAPGFDRKVKGIKLPYNARLKTLCWKLGESFVKVSGKEGATYGKLYAEYKAEELAKNARGANASSARNELAKKKIRDGATKRLLESGKLTDGHVHARAKRRAVKLFLSHYWTIGREARGLPVRAPYATQILGHDREIKSAKGSEQPSQRKRTTKNEQPSQRKRAM
jgi:hypothetical protein